MLYYTTILHPVRKQFNLSNNEYCLVDLIQKLSHNPRSPRPGWCNASRQYMADELGMSRQSVITILKSLENALLIVRGENDHLQTTALWYDAVTGCKESLQGVKKLDSLPDVGCKETLQGVSKNFTPECKETLQGGVKKLDTIIVLDNNTDNSINKVEGGNGADAPPPPTVETVEVIDLPQQQKEEIPPPPVAPPPAPKKSGKPKAEPAHLFSQSPYYDKALFCQQFQDSTYSVYDLNFYYELVRNWADSRKPTRQDWIATARGFMLRDTQEGKAKRSSEFEPVNSHGNNPFTTVRNGRAKQFTGETSAQFGAELDRLFEQQYGT